MGISGITVSLETGKSNAFNVSINNMPLGLIIFVNLTDIKSRRGQTSHVHVAGGVSRLGLTEAGRPILNVGVDPGVNGKIGRAEQQKPPLSAH